MCDHIQKTECGVWSFASAKKSKNQRRHSEGALATEESPAWQAIRIYKFAFCKFQRFYPLKRRGILRSYCPQNDGDNGKRSAENRKRNLLKFAFS